MTCYFEEVLFESWRSAAIFFFRSSPCTPWLCACRIDAMRAPFSPYLEPFGDAVTAVSFISSLRLIAPLAVCDTFLSDYFSTNAHLKNGAFSHHLRSACSASKAGTTQTLVTTSAPFPLFAAICSLQPIHAKPLRESFFPSSQLFTTARAPNTIEQNAQAMLSFCKLLRSLAFSHLEFLRSPHRCQTAYKRPNAPPPFSTAFLRPLRFVLTFPFHSLDAPPLMTL